jgi:hypothetical protein
MHRRYAPNIPILSVGDLEERTGDFAQPERKIDFDSVPVVVGQLIEQNRTANRISEQETEQRSVFLDPQITFAGSYGRWSCFTLFASRSASESGLDRNIVRASLATRKSKRDVLFEIPNESPASYHRCRNFNYYAGTT